MGARVRTKALLVLAATLAGLAGSLHGCKRREGEVACSPGALTFPRDATLVATVDEGLYDLRIVAVGGSDFAVVWSEGPSVDDNDLYGRTVRLDGVASSNEVRITQAAGLSTAVRLSPGPGGLGLSWIDGRFAQYTAMAAVLPGGVLAPASDPAVFQSPTIASDQAPVPALAVTGSGWLVAWNGRGPDGNDHLFMQGLTADGTPAGAPVPVVPDLSDRAHAPSAAALGGGLVLLADTEQRVGSPDFDAWAYLVAGTSLLAEERYGVLSDARFPEAVAFSSGAGLVWLDLRDEGRPDLWYAPFGGGERKLTSGPEANFAHAVASRGDAFLLQWTAGDMLVGGDVVVRAFQPDGRPAGDPRVAGQGVFGDVAWSGVAAGLTWVDGDGQIWFRALVCP